MTAGRTLWAVSDLHVAARGNRELVDRYVRPTAPGDWLIVAGDVAERPGDVAAALEELRRRFATVIWVPGNHELFARADDPMRGRRRYDHLVDLCRGLGVLTPEDPYPSFAGHTVAPLFTLYDHSWRPAGSPPGATAAEAVAAAVDRGVMFTDEVAIAPYVDVPAWCADRVRTTVGRLAAVAGPSSPPTVLVNHWPLVRETTRRLAVPEVALWSGTEHTQEWARRFRAAVVVHGHLHIPVETVVDGVPHVEVSLGYPREQARSLAPRIAAGLWPYPVLRETGR
ncbi:metallophosphoesterase [Corynebacterium bovis]|uniref:metallophosphoesterase family protein n=1 Tax=Corynebacterium bovis TaxID=36808 RepID=UPI00254D6FCB|nr:metallophosphoesterase [Corynebacterium bovis]MDK8510342.1 metallophosphoesterase [Corynebacterium bovis]